MLNGAAVTREVSCHQVLSPSLLKRNSWCNIPINTKVIKCTLGEQSEPHGVSLNLNKG